MHKKIKIAVIIVAAVLVLYLIYKKIKKRKVDNNISEQATALALIATPAKGSGIGYSPLVASKVREFVGRYGNDIIAAIKGTGLYFPAVVAQKAYESGWGASTLAAKYNNFGGIKNFGKLQGAGIVNLMTTEIIKGVETKMMQPFATYPTPYACFEGYVKVLKDPSKKYNKFGVFNAASPEDQILKIAKAGYTTTNPDSYLKAMQSIINAVREIYPLGKIV